MSMEWISVCFWMQNHETGVISIIFYAYSQAKGVKNSATVVVWQDRVIKNLRSEETVSWCNLTNLGGKPMQ